VGVNVTDMAAMELILNNGSMTPGQLAESLKVSTAAATQIVDRLERAGHVARERKAIDRRKIFVVPVEASVAKVFEQLAPMLDGLDNVIAGVAPADRQVIESLPGPGHRRLSQHSGPVGPARTSRGRCFLPSRHPGVCR
jgi:DNA-binding MarR family transcriptional regulator